MNKVCCGGVRCGMAPTVCAGMGRTESGTWGTLCVWSVINAATILTEEQWCLGTGQVSGLVYPRWKVCVPE